MNPEVAGAPRDIVGFDVNRLFRHAARIFCALAMATIVAHSASAGRRVALIIGNAKYEHAETLANTVNDADAIAALLNKAGFDVVDEQRNVGVVEFKRSVREFMLAAANADIAVVYYSGHGMEVGGTNYLIPVDAKLANDFDIEDEAISLDRLILATQPAQTLRLIILDACRDNPFLHSGGATATRSLANRLTSVQPTGTDTLIAYAAKAGSVSYDGVGPNSPFTTALVKYIADPGLDIRIALGKVRDDVLASTNNQQEPFVYGSLGGANISLVPAPVAPVVRPPPIAIDSNSAIAHDYELAERVGARQGWESFLAIHGSGFYADLARAQLAKLKATEIAKSPEAGNDAKKPVEVIANLRPNETQSRTQGAVDRLNPKREQPGQASLDVAAPPASPDQACKRDAARLAQLRGDPSPGPVAQLARDLGCEDLRPQVQRLLESLSPERVSPNPSGPAPAVVQTLAVIAPQQRANASTPAPGAGQQPENVQACQREAKELARIRASPDREASLRLLRNLKCEDLRPQVARLLESIGD